MASQSLEAEDPASVLSSLVPELDALSDADLLPVHADPQTAATTGLLVADCFEQPSLANALSKLADAGVVRADCVVRVQRLARALRFLLEQLGGNYLPDKRASVQVIQKADDSRREMTRRLEEALPGNADVRLWLDAMRRCSGTRDIAFDLRALANLYVDNGDAIARFEQNRALESDPPVEVAQSARRMAAILENALRAGEAPADRERRSRIVRLWSLFVPAYDALCRVGRFVTEGADAQRRFPPLAMIAAHRRAKRAATSLLPEGPPTATTIVIPAYDPVFVADPRDVELLSERPPVPENAEDLDDGWTDPPADEGEIAAPAVVPPPLPELPEPPTPPPLPSAPPHAVSERVEEAPPSSSRGGGREARQHPRRIVEVGVGILSESNFYVGFTENISDTGVFIATYRPSPIGTKVDIRLNLPTGDVEATGVVRWLRNVDACEDWPGMGIQFELVRPGDELRIQEFIRFRDPLFFDDAG